MNSSFKDHHAGLPNCTREQSSELVLQFLDYTSVRYIFPQSVSLIADFTHPQKLSPFDLIFKGRRNHSNRVKTDLQYTLTPASALREQNSMQYHVSPQLVNLLPTTALGLMQNLETKRHQSPPKTNIGGWRQRGHRSIEELKFPENTLFLVRSFTDFISYCKVNCNFSQVSRHLSLLAADPWPPPAPKAFLYF